MASSSLITCSSKQKPTPEKALQVFSASLAMLSDLLTATAEPAAVDILALTESKQFAKREKQQLKKLESLLKQYAPGSAPAKAIKATMERSTWLFDNYGKQGLRCRTDGLPPATVGGDQCHWGEFITLEILFLYMAGWIGWEGRSYLIKIRDEKKPTMKEIIIDVPLASCLMFRCFIWPVAAYREFLNGELVVKNVKTIHSFTPFSIKLCALFLKIPLYSSNNCMISSGPLIIKKGNFFYP